MVVTKEIRMKKMIVALFVISLVQGCGNSAEEAKKQAQRDAAEKEFFTVEFKKSEGKKW